MDIEQSATLAEAESEAGLRSKEWLARTFVATIYLVAGAGNMAFAAHYSVEHDVGNFMLSLAGGICGCFAACGVACAR